MAARKTTTAPVAHSSLNEALLAVQADMPGFQKDRVNPHFNSAYLSLESLMPQVVEVLTAHGLLLTQMPTHVNGTGALLTRFTHVSTGESVESEMLLSAGKETPQGQGAAITYARRYAVTCGLNITVERDDDANAAMPARAAVQPVPAVAASVAGFGQGDQGVGTAFGSAL